MSHKYHSLESRTSALCCIKYSCKKLILNETQRFKLSLLVALVQRSLEVRYRGSLLGRMWPLLNQLAQVLIYTYVLSIVLRVRSGLDGGGRPLTFGLWLFAGLLPWSTFSSGLSRATGSVITQPNLVKKVVFPLTLLPLVPILTTFIESTIGMVMLTVFIGIVTQKIHPTLLLLPLVWIPQLCLTAGLGFLLASLTVFIRDIRQIIDVFLRLWFYATPIIYPASRIPEPFQTLVLWLNPIASIAEMYRDVMLVGSITHWVPWLISTGISLVVLAIGLWCYGKLRPAFADVI